MNTPSYTAVLVMVFLLSFLATTLIIQAAGDGPPQTFPAAGCFELRTTDSTRVGEQPEATERWQTVERIEWGCP